MRVREKMDFGWRFYRGDATASGSVGMGGALTDCVVYTPSETSRFMLGVQPAEQDSLLEGWTEVDLPHDWLLEEEYVNRPELAYGGFLPRSIACYRKVFDLPASDEGREVFIEFDGIYRNSTVWVNGHNLGTHASGYTSFHYDITSVARYGDEGRNVIFVRVDPREAEGWWYEGAGIYRHGWLVRTDRLHVDHWGTYVTTPRVSTRSARVVIRTTIANDYDQDMAHELVSRIHDAEGREVASVSSAGRIAAHRAVEVQQTTTIARPELWSVERPYLYKVISEVRSGDRVTDVYETPLGIRTIEFTSDRGFLLNGKQVLIKGTCNHQDFAGVGIALPDSIIEYKLRLLKEMGSNAYRSAHHPPTPELLDICDRIGMLVMDENRHLDDSPDGIADLERMIRRDRNHPCVVLWSMENEETLQAVPKMGPRVLRNLVDAARKLDPTRPTTAAVCHGWDDPTYRDVLDVIGYNYGQVMGREAEGRVIGHDLHDHMVNPNRKSVGSETASNPVTRGVYEENQAKGYCSPFVVYPSFYWTVEAVEKTWQKVVDNPFLSGIFFWTGFDYRGEPGVIRTWPCIASQYGAFDLCGFPKDKYYYYRSVWTRDPVVHIFPHWTWPGREGEELEVWAYSNCEAVELLLNGESLGKKEMMLNSHLTWRVRYAPGRLSAKAWKRGRVAAKATVETTEAPTRMILEPHRAAIQADGCDCSIVRVSVLDDRDRVVPIADDEISFLVEGPGKILGLGNGDPSSHEPDKSSIRRAFNGHCLAIIQSSREQGTLTLRATSPRLRPTAVTIESR